MALRGQLRRVSDLSVLTCLWLGLAAAVASAHTAADPTLVDKARKEGRVVWYTTQIISELAIPVAEAFHAAYGIEVRCVRVPPREVARRVIEEAKAGRAQADIVDGITTVPALKKAGLLLRWEPAGAGRLPPHMVDPDGAWVATNQFINGLVYNTDLVAAKDAPLRQADLLESRWQGRMVWSSVSAVSGAAGFIGTILKRDGAAVGRSFLEALSRQQITTADLTARQVLDKVIDGDFAIGLQMYNHQAAISAGKGAPIAWAPLDTATGSLSVAAVLAAAPHPSGARLLVEFLISEQGQRLFREADYLPADPTIEPKNPALLPAGGRYPVVFFSPEEIDAGMPQWQGLAGDVFR